jgi:hypothetical protein
MIPSTDALHGLTGLRFIGRGVDLRRIGLRMPQDDLSGFQAEPGADLRPGRMAKPMGVPMADLVSLTGVGD